MITDAQVHLWEASRPDRPWAANAEAHLPEPMTAERMIGLMDEAGIDRAVISPPGVLPDRGPAYALEVAAKYPKRFRVMPWFIPTKQEQFDSLPRWMDTPGVCSLRLSLNEGRHMELLGDGGLEPLWTACERQHIPVALFRRDGLGVAEDAIRRHPGMPVIIDHFNWAADDADRERKIQEMESLAKYPNVHIKVSSLPKLTKSPPPYPDLEPLIKRVHAAYGAKRLMWGSDQTQIMAIRNGSYRDNVDIIRVSAAKYLPAADIEQMLHGTATKVFNWPAG